MAEIKNLKKAANRIKKAIKNQENIILYSDADLDGATSLIILEETIKSLGGRVAARYFPDRSKDGYGLNKKALESFKKYSPAVLILTDCGIGNFEELAIAEKNGFETIVVEHHEILGKLPPASIIVDPKQKGDKYPFKFFAACGIAFKLSLLIFKGNISLKMEQSFLELVALGTLADMMPQNDDNKVLTDKGLKFLPGTFRPGLRVFFDFFAAENLSSNEIVKKMISILQISGLENHLTQTYLLLTSSSLDKVLELLKKLLKESQERRDIVYELAGDFIEEISETKPLIIFKGGPEVPIVSTGSLASKLYNKFKIPVFIYNSNGKVSVGSARVGKELNSVEILAACKPLLETFGGHPPAAGFRVKNSNLKKLKLCLFDYFGKHPLKP